MNTNHAKRQVVKDFIILVFLLTFDRKMTSNQIIVMYFLGVKLLSKNIFQNY